MTSQHEENESREYYTLLGVDRDAEQEDIKKAYRFVSHN